MKVQFILIALLLTLHTTAQKAPARPAEDIKAFRASEDSLTALGNIMVNGRTSSERFEADSQFTRILVRALKIKNSFFYPFDSLENVSHLYAPDTTFRIFTWEIMVDDDNFRRHGAIQMRTPDGSLKLVPLIDRTKVMSDLMDTVTNNEYWVGNIYYKIVEKKFQGKSYYTLLGYDENDLSTTRKWIEVMTLDGNQRPVFGGQYFTFQSGDPEDPKVAISRYMIEYKKGGTARVQYDPDLDLIILDHLESESNEPDKKYTLIPDGDYEGFRWVNGKWVHINKVFTYKLQDGQAPAPSPLKKQPHIGKEGG